MSVANRFAGVALITLASLLMVVDVSMAQQRKSGGQTEVWKFLSEKYDTNNDGKLTKKEYDRGAETFARFDLNKDGVLTAADWSSARGSASRGRSKRPGTGRGATAPEAGDRAPDFDLAYVNEPSTSAQLSSFAGKKPVALIFGSCT